MTNGQFPSTRKQFYQRIKIITVGQEVFKGMSLKNISSIYRGNRQLQLHAKLAVGGRGRFIPAHCSEEFCITLKNHWIGLSVNDS